MSDGRAAKAAEWAATRETVTVEENYAVMATLADEVMDADHEDDVFRQRVHALLIKTYHRFKDTLDAAG